MLVWYFKLSSVFSCLFRLFLSLSLSLYIYIYIYLSIYPSIYLCIYLLYVSLSIYIYIIFCFFFFSLSLSFSSLLSLSLSISLSLSLLSFLSLSLSIYLSGTIPAAEVPTTFLSLTSAPEFDYDNKANLINSAVSSLGEQLQQKQDDEIALWIHATEQDDHLFQQHEFAQKACEQTGGEIRMTGFRFDNSSVHPQSTMDPVILSQLLSYLDDWNMSGYGPYVSDFIWSMDDSRHAEPISKDLPRIKLINFNCLLTPMRYQHRWRTSASASLAVAELTGRDPTINENFCEREIKRQRQGLQINEMSSSEQLDVTVYNLGNLARQIVQHEEPHMLRVLMNQTSHIMILVEGSSLTVNQCHIKLRTKEWVLARADDHRWVGARQAARDASVKPTLARTSSNIRRREMRL